MYNYIYSLLYSMILIQHLVKTQEQCGLVAAMTFSSPWNLDHFVSHIEKPILNKLIYNKTFVNDNIEYVER